MQLLINEAVLLHTLRAPNPAKQLNSEPLVKHVNGAKSGSRVLATAVCLLAALATGCGEESFEITAEKMQQSDALFPQPDSLWDSPTIPVCWQNPEAAPAAERTWVQEAAQNSWAAVSNVNFTGWGRCPSSSDGIRILIEDGWPHTRGLGKELAGKKDGMLLNFTFRNWAITWTTASTRGQHWPGWWVGDFDGDGSDDILRYTHEYGGAEVHLANRYRNFKNGTAWSQAGTRDKGWWVGDFNGDGKDDILRYTHQYGGAEVHLSDGARFLPGVAWSQAGARGGKGWWVGDFNGDGKDDILRYTNANGGAEVHLSDGTRFVAGATWTGAGTGSAGDWWVGDFNGDGKDDILRNFNTISGAEVFLSTGSGFEPGINHLGGTIWTTEGNRGRGWSVGDFDGDGKDDLMRVGPNGGGYDGADVLLSTGNRFVDGVAWTDAESNGYGWFTGDYDGDGKTDIFRYSAGSTEPVEDRGGADVFLSQGNRFLGEGICAMNDANREFCLRSIAIHEFGHALGFAHEHHRLDTPATCTRPQQGSCRDGEDGCEEFGPYDAMSVMNYCAPWRTNLSKFDELGVQESYGFPAWTNAGTRGKGWWVGDFDADGKDDILRYAHAYGGAQVYLSNGTAFAGGSTWTTASTRGKGWVVGDFDGDGQDDILRHAHRYGGAKVHLSTGTNFSPGSTWTTFSTNGRDWLVGDFDGDNKDDLLRYTNSNGGAEVFLSTGTRFAYTGKWSTAGTRGRKWVVGDFNCDGKDDIMRVAWAANSSIFGGAQVFLSTGSSFVGGSTWTLGFTNGEDWLAGDFKIHDADGDGNVDQCTSIMSPIDARGRGAAVYFPNKSATGRWTFTPQWFTPSSTPWTYAGNRDHKWYVGDFDGDGADDIFRYKSQYGGAEMFLSTGSEFAATLAP